MLDKDKVDILKHFDSEFRQDWRSLTNLRTIISTLYVGLQTSLIGWFLGTKKEVLPENIHVILYLSCAISGVGIISLFFCSRSINQIKKNIVKVEDALLLFEDNIFMNTSILNINDKNWGSDKWIGKTILASILIGSIFPLILYFLKARYSC